MAQLTTIYDIKTAEAQEKQAKILEKQSEILKKQAIFNALLFTATLMLALTASMTLFTELFLLGYNRDIIFVIGFFISSLIFLIILFLIIYKITTKVLKIFD